MIKRKEQKQNNDSTNREGGKLKRDEEYATNQQRNNLNDFKSPFSKKKTEQIQIVKADEFQKKIIANKQLIKCKSTDNFYEHNDQAQLRFITNNAKNISICFEKYQRELSKLKQDETTVGILNNLLFQIQKGKQKCENNIINLKSRRKKIDDQVYLIETEKDKFQWMANVIERTKQFIKQPLKQFPKEIKIKTEFGTKNIVNSNNERLQHYKSIISLKEQLTSDLILMNSEIEIRILEYMQPKLSLLNQFFTKINKVKNVKQLLQKSISIQIQKLKKNKNYFEIKQGSVRITELMY